MDKGKLVTASDRKGSHWSMARRTIALSGVCLVLLGLVTTSVFNTLPATAAAHNGWMLLILLAAASLTSVVAPLRFVDAIPLVILVLLLRFVGPAALLAATLVLAAAMVVGFCLCRKLGKLGHVTSATCGVAILTGVTGWLLPFHIHTFLAYITVFGSIAVLGRRILFHTLRGLLHQWRQATRAAPVAAAFAMSMVALCCVALFPPTVQFDDLAYHILLPSQLANISHYKLDVASQAWAAAPWASDVVQGFIAVLTGHEARGAANALWLLISVGMLWNLGAEVGLKASMRWLSVALFASQPIVSSLNGSMQADTAVTAAGLTLVTLTARLLRTRRLDALVAFMATSGLLMALKTTQALLIAPMAVIILFHLGTGKFLKKAIFNLPMALMISGSSYAYAWYITRNPVFPLFNGLFRSPYAPASNFDDARWHQGFSWDSLWQITFHTGNYQEALPGAFGFALLALFGCVLLALWHPKTRWLVAGLLITITSSFATIQYVRYLVPLMAPLITLALVAWQTVELRRVGQVLLGGVALLNAAFIPAAGYPLMDDINWHTLSKLNRTPVEARTLIDRRYAVESLVAHHMSVAWPHGYSIYLADPARPFVAPFAGNAIGRSWYDPGVSDAAREADADPTGAAWLNLFERTGMSHVLTVGPAPEPMNTALRRAQAKMELTIENATLWRLCKSNCNEMKFPLLQQRDTSQRLFK